MQDDSVAPVISAQQDKLSASETLPIEIRGPPDLPGLRLVDPDTSNWQGQIIYLDFDGEQNVTVLVQRQLDNYYSRPSEWIAGLTLAL